MSDEKREIARKRAKGKMDFIRHLGTYIVVMVVLIIINNATSTSYQWWIWPAGGWGIAIVGHLLGTFVFSDRLEQKLIDKELEKMDEQ